MKFAESHPNLAAFVLDGLEPEEAAVIRHHLARCPDCRRELRELEKVNSALKAAPPLEDPPGYIKDDVLSRVRAGDQPRFSRVSKRLRFALSGAAAVCAAAMLVLGIVFGMGQESPTATIRLVPAPGEAGELQNYWGVAEIYPQPPGNLRVELKLNNFGEPEPDSYYEAWFVSGEKRIGAGSFTSVGKGTTRVWLTVAPEARNYHTLLITEEHVDRDPIQGEGVTLKGKIP